MVTFLFVLALYAGLAGAVAYARRDRFTGPPISDYHRSVRGAHHPRSARSQAVPTARTHQQDSVRTAHCAC